MLLAPHEAPGSQLGLALRVLVILSLPLLGSLGYASAYAFTSLRALRGSVYALESLALSVLLAMLNPGVFPESPLPSTARWVVLVASFVGGVYQFYREGHSYPPLAKNAAAFCSVAALLSLTTSYALDVSLFKLSMFFIGSLSVILNCTLATRSAHRLQGLLLTLPAVVATAGFPLLFLPTGYTKNGLGFQGLLAHPQPYAVFIAPFLAWLLVLHATGRVRGWAASIVTLIGVTSLFATQARTGVAALAIGLTAAIIVGVFRRQHLSKRALVRIVTLGVGCAVATSALALNTRVITNFTTNIIYKQSGERSIEDALSRSRGGVVRISTENITRHPLVGIGFGLPSSPSQLEVIRDPLLGLPVSAPVEKGVLFVGALEELGAVGFAFFGVLAFRLLSPPLQSGLPAMAALSFAAFGTNVGEATFFSFGGIGVIVWIYMASAASNTATNRLRRRTAVRHRLPHGE